MEWFNQVSQSIKQARLLGPELLLGKLYDEIEFYEPSEDDQDTTSTRMEAFNYALREEVVQMFDDLDAEELSVLQNKKRFTKRYLLVASTRELAEKKILMHRNGSPLDPDKLPKRKRMVFHPENLRKAYCRAIDKSDPVIDIPTDFSSIKNGYFHTQPYDKGTYRLESTDEPRLSQLKVFNNNAFGNLLYSW